MAGFRPNHKEPQKEPPLYRQYPTDGTPRIADRSHIDTPEYPGSHIYIMTSPNPTPRGGGSY